MKQKNHLLDKPWKSDGKGIYITCGGQNVCEIRGWGYLSKVVSETVAEETQKRIQTLIVQSVNEKLGFKGGIK